MKPYPRYKPTGLAWLPSVPEHWEVVPFKHLFTLGKGLPITKADLVESGTPVVSYGQIHSKTNKGTALSAELIRFVNPVFAATKPTARLRKGDFAFADTSEDVAGCGNCVFNNRNDEVFGGYHTILAFSHRPEHGRYLSYLFQAPRWRDQIRRFANGVKVYSVTGRILNAATVTLPMASEQDRIVRYLDEKTAAIDELVRAKEREIDLLRERKQAHVSAAVIGRDASTMRPGCGRAMGASLPEFRDSGIYWIGKIPKGWVVVKLSRRYSVQLGKMLDAKKIKGQSLMPYLRNQDVQWEGVNSENLPKMDFSAEEQVRFGVRKGDLLVCEGGEIGRSAIWESDKPCCFQKAIIRLRPRKPTEDSVRFMWYLMFAATANHAFDFATGKATIAHLPAEKLSAAQFAFPPLPEQERIVAHLDSVCSELDAAETAIRKQISLLQELRTRLVSDAVTGAVEV